MYANGHSDKTNNNKAKLILFLKKDDGTGDSTFAPNISAGLQRLKKSIKSLPQLFIYREGDGEVEMEIGFPTNVQHVAHVGWGGSDGTGASMNSWDAGPSDLFSLPSVSGTLGACNALSW